MNPFTVSSASPAVTVIVDLPNPNTSDFTVTSSPDRISTSPLVFPPTGSSINPPSKVMLYPKSVRSSLPIFLIIAVTPNPHDISILMGHSMVNAQVFSSSMFPALSTE